MLSLMADVPVTKRDQNETWIILTPHFIQEISKVVSMMTMSCNIYTPTLLYGYSVCTAYKTARCALAIYTCVSMLHTAHACYIHACIMNNLVDFPVISYIVRVKLLRYHHFGGVSLQQRLLQTKCLPQMT